MKCYITSVLNTLLIVAVASLPGVLMADDMHHQAGMTATPVNSMPQGGMAAGNMPMMGMMQDINNHMQKMQELMLKIQQTKSSDEKQKLMQEHMSMMQSGMNMMKGMGGDMMGADHKMQGAMSGENGSGATCANGAVMETRMNMMEQMMD